MYKLNDKDGLFEKAFPNYLHCTPKLHPVEDSEMRREGGGRNKTHKDTKVNMGGKALGEEAAAGSQKDLDLEHRRREL
jgi:hypothetical protein